MNKSKNKKHHKWVDRGGKKAPIYIYDCKYCGCERIKQDFCTSTYIKDGVSINRAPECLTTQ